MRMTLDLAFDVSSVTPQSLILSDFPKTSSETLGSVFYSGDKWKYAIN